MNGAASRFGRFGSRLRAAGPGFSLVELMIVVVIIGLLSAVAIPIYRTQRLRGRTVEATEMLGKIVAAQEAYHAGFGQYSDVSNDLTASSCAVDGTRGTLGPSGAYWPTLGAARSDPARTVDFYAGMPVAWNQLGVRPRTRLRFAYQTIAGNPGVVPSVGAGGDLGYASLPPNQKGDWFYAVALGDLDEDGVYSTFEVSSLRQGVTIRGNELE